MFFSVCLCVPTGLCVLCASYGCHSEFNPESSGPHDLSSVVAEALWILALRFPSLSPSCVPFCWGFKLFDLSVLFSFWAVREHLTLPSAPCPTLGFSNLK